MASSAAEASARFYAVLRWCEKYHFYILLAVVTCLLMVLYQEFLFGDMHYIYIRAGQGGDEFRSYLPALTWARSWIADPAFYSLQIGAGESVFVWSHIYLDPFNWPTYLVPEQRIPDALLWMQVLKHLCILYLGYRWLREIGFDAAASTGGAIILVCIPSAISPHYQFVSTYVYTLLFVYGLERAMNGRGFMVAFAGVTLVTMLSVYILYKLALFTGLYLAGRAIARGVAFRPFVHFSLAVLGTATLAVLILAPVIFATLELILSNPRSEATFTNPKYLLSWVFESPLLRSAFGLGPALALVLPGLFLAPRRLLVAGALAVVSVLLFSSNRWFMALSTGFAKEFEFYTDYLFAIPLVTLICYGMHNRDRLNPKAAWLAATALALGLLVFAINSPIEPYLGYCLLPVCLALFLQDRRPRLVVALVLVPLACTMGVWLHAISSERNNSWPMLPKSATSESSDLAQLRLLARREPQPEQAQSLGRAVKTFTVSGLNDSMLLDYRGVEAQNSIVNPNHLRFAQTYFNSTNASIQVLNSQPQPLLDRFLGVNRIYSEGNLVALPGQSTSARAGRFIEYSVAKPLELGLFTPYRVSTEAFRGLGPQQRHWQLHNAALGDTLPEEMIPLAPEDIPATPAFRTTVLDTQWQIVKREPGKTFYRVTLPANASALKLRLQLQFPSAGNRWIQVIGRGVGGERLNALGFTLHYARDGAKHMAPLPPGNARYQMGLQLYRYAELYIGIAGADHGQLKSLQVQGSELKIIDLESSSLPGVKPAGLSFDGDDAISGMVEIDRPGMVVLQVPYSREWRLTVDGVPGTTSVVNRGLLGVYLDAAGRYRIDLKYRPRYWGVSCSAAVIGLLASMAVLAWARRRQPGENQAPSQAEPGQL